MAIVLTDNTNYQNIANAIRNKNGSSDIYSPSQMATAINNIPSGGIDVQGEIDTRYAEYPITTGEFVSSIPWSHVVEVDEDYDILYNTLINIRHYKDDIYLMLFTSPTRSSSSVGLNLHDFYIIPVRMKDGVIIQKGAYYNNAVECYITYGNYNDVRYVYPNLSAYITKHMMEVYGDNIFCNFGSGYVLLKLDENSLSFNRIEYFQGSSNETLCYLKDRYYLHCTVGSGSSYSRTYFSIYRVDENEINKGPSYLKELTYSNRYYIGKGDGYNFGVNKYAFRVAEEDSRTSDVYRGFSLEFNFETLSVSFLETNAMYRGYPWCYNGYNYCYHNSNYYKINLSTGSETSINQNEYQKGVALGQIEERPINNNYYMELGFDKLYIRDENQENVYTYANASADVIDGKLFKCTASSPIGSIIGYDYSGFIQDLSVVPYNGTNIYGIAASNSSNNYVQVLRPTGGEN